MAKGKALPVVLANRIVAHGDVAPVSLVANPYNFRRHPESQRAALRGSLRELGWLKTVVVNKTTGHVLDGHARVEEAIAAGVATIPVTYVVMDEAEEKLALAVLDPITELATRDNDALVALLGELNTNDDDLRALLDALDPTPVDVNAHWQGMPEFEQEDASAYQRIVLHFADADAVAAFAKLVEQTVTPTTRYLWYPRALRQHEVGVSEYAPVEERADE